MRCHQHFPRSDLKVKEEVTTDTEGEGSLMGDSMADMRGASPLPSATGDGRPQTSPCADAATNHVHIKEEPQERDLSVLSPFTMCHKEPPAGLGMANSLDLSGAGPGMRSSPGGPATPSLFSGDISSKTATDLLMKLSGKCQRSEGSFESCFYRHVTGAIKKKSFHLLHNSGKRKSTVLAYVK